MSFFVSFVPSWLIFHPLCLTSETSASSAVKLNRPPVLENAPGRWYVVPPHHTGVTATGGAELLVAALERIDPQLPEPEEGLEGLVVE